MSAPVEPTAVVVIDGVPRPSCHPTADLEIQRSLPADVGVYEALALYGSAQDGALPELSVRYVKVYEGWDGGDFTVECAMCGRSFAEVVEVSER